jgi:squalene cyclase
VSIIKYLQDFRFGFFLKNVQFKYRNFKPLWGDDILIDGYQRYLFSSRGASRHQSAVT